MARVTQAHIDARREDILIAARNLFLNRGFSSVTMQDIADEAGISAGAIYRYFPSKNELIRSYFVHCAGTGPATMIRQVAPEAPPRERLRALAENVKNMWIENNGEHIISEVQMAMASMRQPDVIGLLVHDAREQLYEALLEIVEAGQRTGEIDPNLDPRALVVNLNAWVLGIGLLALETGEEEFPEQLELMFETFFEVLERLGPADAGAD